MMVITGWLGYAGATAFMLMKTRALTPVRALLAGIMWPTWPFLIAGSWVRYRLKRRTP